ncbi:MAG: hypothetical protein HWQ35_14265 [Nostoc sp. NMS1]|uniref:hypothetical protein n=1 Tax=unclassified Nostoc TaxID=2593658 RepID=UPI0025D80FB7|nr:MULTISPECIES: hypothetical protein [unclassified Nostoc]MBN3907673.1 hypothetical protein [Nostoc sp. NMS1]MBN3992960.1 hypothetical protein [Nostoc sp. NMS2]
MTEQQISDKPLNGQRPSPINSRKGRKKEWKDLAIDPLSEGYDSHQAEYVVGKAPMTWALLEVGQLFSRSKSGKNLHVKLNDGRAVCLDTRQAIEFKPPIRNSQQVWVVTNFNSTSANKADF